MEIPVCTVGEELIGCRRCPVGGNEGMKGHTSTPRISLSAAIIIILIILGQSVSTGASTSVVTFRSPYNGASVATLGNNARTIFGCGASIHSSDLGSLNLSNGDFRAHVNTSVAGCGANGAATIRHGVGITNLNFTVSRAGLYSLRCDWAARIKAQVFSNESAFNPGYNSASVKLTAYCAVSGGPGARAYQRTMINAYTLGFGSKSLLLLNQSTVVRGSGINLTAGVTYTLTTYLHYFLEAWGGKAGSLVAASLDITPPRTGDSLIFISVY